MTNARPFPVHTVLPDLLGGIRVVDLSRNLPGPFCGDMLAGLGADVLKVEPSQGDPARAIPSLFAALNGGKRTSTIDFGNEADLAGLRTRIAAADVLIDSARPGVRAAMGLGASDLRAANPRLVSVSISGYGATGTWSGRAGHDLNFMAVSGALDQSRMSSGALSPPNVQWGDLAAGGTMAAVAILAALVRAGRTGAGADLTVSMAHGLHTYLVLPKATRAMLEPLLGHAPGPGEDMLNGGLPCYSIYPTADGRHLAVGALEWKFWRTACDGFDRPQWADRHWQRGLPIGSPENLVMRDEVAALVATRDLAVWTARFDPFDACVTPVLTLAEAGAHDALEFGTRAWLEETGG